jgi:hypothetical protein
MTSNTDLLQQPDTLQQPPLMKKKSNLIWKVIFITLLTVNVLFVFWIVVTYRESQTAVHFGFGRGYTFLELFLLSLRLAIIDLIVLSLYLFIRLPHSPAKAISYSSVLIFLGPICIYVLGGDLGIQHMYKAIRETQLSREAAITLINNCRVKSIERVLKSDQFIEIDLGEETRNVAADDYDELRYAALAAKNRCGHIRVKDYTLGYGYQVRDGIVYYSGLLIEEADYKAFEYVGEGYAKDATHVFYEGVIAPNADPANCMVHRLSGCQSY